MTGLRRLLIVVAAVIACCAAAWYWLLHTNSGAAWAMAQAESLTAGALTTRSVSGDLGSGLGIGGVAYDADGLSVTAAAVSLSIDVDLLPFSVEIVSPRIEAAQVTVSGMTDTQATPTDIPELLRKLQLPWLLRVSGLVVDGLAVESPGFAHTISLLELEADWQDSIVVKLLRADGEDIYVEASGSFDLANDLVHAGNVMLRLEPGITGYTEAIEIGVRSEGNPDRLGLHIGVEDLAAQASGEVRHLFEQPLWDIEVAVPHYVWPLDDSDETVEVHDLSMRSTGTLDAWTLQATGDVQAPGIQRLSAAVDGEGNQQGFTATMLRVDGTDLEVSGTASVTWAGERGLETSLTIAHANPQFLVQAWPDEFPIQGTVNATLDETRLIIREAQLIIPRAEALLQVEADIDRNNGDVLAALRWQNLRWPLDGDAYDIRSDHADVQVGGTLDAWSVDGMIEIGAFEMPGGTFRLSGSGDRDTARARILEASVLGGTLDGELEYSWRDAQPWRGRVNVATLETGSLFPDWPGRVSGQIEASGQVAPLVLSAEFTNISGTLRNESLAASGGISVAPDKLIVRNFSATHGASIFRANGGLDEAHGLSFEIVIADVADYIADLSGDLAGSGVVRTTPGHSYLSLTLDAEELQYAGTVINSLRIDDIRTADQVAGMRLTATGIEIDDREFGELDALLEVTTERQSLTVSGAYQDSTMSVSLDGALDDWSAPLTAGWRGTIQTLEVAPDDQHVARLLSPVEIYVSSEKVDVGEACVGPDPDATICATGNWEASGAYNVAAHLRSVPVGLLDYVVETGLAFDQAINGEVQWSHRPATGPSGFGRLAVTPGRVSGIEDPRLTLATGEGTLNFRISERKLLNGTLGLPLPGTGKVNGSFRLHDLDNIGTSGISGGLVADVAEIAILSPLIPAVDVARGRLQVDMNLTGSVEAPLLRGTLSIDDGRIAFAPLGLILDNLSLTAEMTENYRVEVDGDFRSGDGHGAVTALVDYSDYDEPFLRVDFTGERLALVNVEDVRIAANPDFELLITPEMLSIDGGLHIPEARVTPVRLPGPQAYESPDVVIVAGELPDMLEPDRTQNLQYSGSLDVSLGDKVVIDLDVARASAAGKVSFDWRGDSMPFANGRYDITGTVNVFGQVLDISRGSLRFPDVPADSPVIRIQAEREIFGNTQVKRAGVLVDGPLTRPIIGAYTEPRTTEERALTLLVTGSDFDYEQGVGAIDFGTYIAPRFFVSYGIGVFERDNIVSARFDLTRNLGIKASSGDKETGVDLSYRFEN